MVNAAGVGGGSQRGPKGADFTFAAHSCPSVVAMICDAIPMTMFATFPAPIARFLKDESGAVAADYIFMTSAVTAAGFAVLTSLSGGIEDLSGELMSELSNNDLVFMSQHFGRDRVTVLMEGPRERFSPNGMRNRYNIFSDPARRTDAQVRNAHRTWSRRLNDPAYSQPDRAADMVRILDMSLEVRNLEPHNNI